MIIVMASVLAHLRDRGRGRIAFTIAPICFRDASAAAKHLKVTRCTLCGEGPQPSLLVSENSYVPPGDQHILGVA